MKMPAWWRKWGCIYSWEVFARRNKISKCYLNFVGYLVRALNFGPGIEIFLFLLMYIQGAFKLQNHFKKLPFSFNSAENWGSYCVFFLVILHSWSDLAHTGIKIKEKKKAIKSWVAEIALFFAVLFFSVLSSLLEPRHSITLLSEEPHLACCYLRCFRGASHLSFEIYNILKMIGWGPCLNGDVSRKGHGLEKPRTQLNGQKRRTWKHGPKLE